MPVQRLSSWLVRLFLWLALACGPAQAGSIALSQLEAVRTDQGVLLTFDTEYELPHGVEDALQKGVALHFVAKADLMYARWYWRDRPISSVTRNWRLTYQPLTFSYRVSLGGLSQSYRSIGEALRAVQRATRWRISDPIGDEEDRYYVEFSYRLDASQLPRPLQIGLGNLPDWRLEVEHTVPVAPVAPR
ncbi:MAG: hypothetical protein RLY71_675 [Pseudomonadota bacterium]